MIIISILIITVWLLFYSYHVSKTLSDEVNVRDMILVVFLGSVYPFIKALNIILKPMSNIQLVYYVAVVSEISTEDSE